MLPSESELSTPDEAGPKHVGLLVEPLQGQASRILEGVGRWMRRHPEWRVAVFDGTPSELLPLARNWHGDGVVCTLTSEELREAISSRGIPVVNIEGQFPINKMGSVVSNQDACAQMALDYFRDRGFTRCGFVGDPTFTAGQALGRAFRKLSDADVKTFEGKLGDERGLAGWLSAQARPFAILADSDRQAACVLEACHLAGLAVPEEVAVLGIGNRTHLCELCTPALSSIDCDPEARGYQAAALLGRIMAGDTPEPVPVMVPPVGVVTRRSTETYAFEDVNLGRALRYIRENAHRSIKVTDVLGATNLSRRSLENRFRRHFSRSIHEEIWRVHFELAKNLLASTDLGLQEVAARSGFRTASALANLFKQKTGLTPRTYRAANRRSVYQ